MNCIQQVKVTLNLYTPNWCVEHPAQPDKQLTCRQGWELAQGAQEPGWDNGRAQTWHGTHVSTALY